MAIYLVGEPLFQPDERKTFFAPTGQVGICLKVLQEAVSYETVYENLAREYLAIIYCLWEMGVDFRIIYAHPDKIAANVIAICVGKLGCKLAGFGADFFPPSVAYPRDFSTIIPGTLLLNEYTRLTIGEKNGWKLIVSPWGEGGRILLANRHAVIPERICMEKRSRLVEKSDTQPLRDAGLKIMFLPPPLLSRTTVAGEIEPSSFNDHLDRVACLLRDKGGDSHLIVEPGIEGIRTAGRKIADWEFLSTGETIAVIRERAAEAGIHFHVAPPLRVPYSLNVFQHADGRVLMTGGEDDLSALVGEIIGRDMVTATPVPIRYFPARNYAGIRCLVNEAPTPLLIKNKI